ncbi:MAG TPA: radical SAM protein [Desulfonatronum sp.]|nr:radical SAM protein [Desulfonatronum sp.]
MLFIHPAVAKPCEPPAGIARLVGVLRSFEIPCGVLDANLEGLLWLMRRPIAASDRWTRRAVRNREHNLERIRGWNGYARMDGYRRVVADLNRLVATSVQGTRIRMSLANYQDACLTPARSQDLLQAAERPEQNPLYSYFEPRLTALMEAEQPGLVGISLNYLSQALCAFAMAGFLRRNWPEVPLIMGGGLVTSWMRSPGWSDPFAGLVEEMVAGAGEEPLLARFGIYARKRLGRHLAVECSLFPVQDYFAPGPILPYSASRGCYWNRCAFCPEQAEGNRYVPTAHSQVVADLHGLVRQTRPVLIHLLDNALSPGLLKTLAMNAPGAPWYGFARFSQDLAEVEFCQALRASGCVMLKLGLESGDQGVLDREGKGVDLGLAARVLKNLATAGIAAYVYLLFGTPSESEDEARATLEFTVLHSEDIAFLNLAIFNLPLAGSGREGLEVIPHSDGDLSLYAGFRHPRGWDRTKVRRFLDREFRRHPAMAAILRRDPRFFTSNHAAFFSMVAAGGPGMRTVSTP